MYDYTHRLPAGTVVLLKNANKRLMIVGYQRYALGEPEKIYDYAGVYFPEGFLAPDKIALFDHDQIDRIIFMGLQSGEQIAYGEALAQAIRENQEKIAQEDAPNPDEVDDTPDGNV